MSDAADIAIYVISLRVEKDRVRVCAERRDRREWVGHNGTYEGMTFFDGPFYEDDWPDLPRALGAAAAKVIKEADKRGDG